MSAPVAGQTAISITDPVSTSTTGAQAQDTAPESQVAENKAASPVEQAPDAAALAPGTDLKAAEANNDSTTGNGISASPSTASKTESAVRISLLLSTGNRHPFTINNKFLQRHNIQATDADPWNIRVYDMKTLIWHEWLSEWETKPTSPSLIRLIFLGGLLDDKAALKDCRFSKTESNVVHMTVKPQDLLDDDEVKGKEQKQGSTRQRRSGGGCCVIL